MRDYYYLHHHYHYECDIYNKNNEDRLELIDITTNNKLLPLIKKNYDIQNLLLQIYHYL